MFKSSFSQERCPLFIGDSKNLPIGETDKSAYSNLNLPFKFEHCCSDLKQRTLMSFWLLLSLDLVLHRSVKFRIKCSCDLFFKFVLHLSTCPLVIEALNLLLKLNLVEILSLNHHTWCLLVQQL